MENICLRRPHDACSIYFILEKERNAHELSAKGSSEKKAAEHQQELSFDLAGYDFLSLPDPPTQYRNLKMPHGWFVRGKDCQPNACEGDNRRLVGFFSSPLFCYLIRCIWHIFASFLVPHNSEIIFRADVYDTAVANWEVVDRSTRAYCERVACILMERHSLLTGIGGIGCLPARNTVSHESNKRKSINTTNEGRAINPRHCPDVYSELNVKMYAPQGQNYLGSNKIREVDISDSDIFRMWYQVERRQSLR